MSFAEPRFATRACDVDARTTVMSVAGEIHVSTAPGFRDVLNTTIDAGRTALVLDLSDVVFIDSTGLSVLLNALRRLDRRDGAMTLVARNPTVLRLFEITQLDATFAIHAELEPALAAAQAAAGGRTAGAP